MSIAMKIVKIVAYLILLGVVAYSFQKFRQTHAEASAAAAQRTEKSALIADRANGNAREGNNGETNAAAATPPAKDGATTDSSSDPKNLQEAPKPDSNAADNASAPPPTDVAANTNAPTAPAQDPKAAGPATAPASQRWPLYLGIFLTSLIALGLLLAWDVSRAVASRAHSAVFMEDSSAGRDPEYDEAEDIWKQGRYLEAIDMLRGFLKKNPSEQYAAIRIAEIYEKDLNNPAVASMELEEVLTKRLPAEKWGWTAIHLANIYSGRLNQPDRALDLLHRIIQEYPQTGAAKKARGRLGIPEPEETLTPQTDASSTGSPETPAASDDTASGLPPGFRPKR